MYTAFVFVLMLISFHVVNGFRRKAKCSVENGNIIKSEGDKTTFSCREGFVSNVKQLENANFECKFIRKKGIYAFYTRLWTNGGQRDDVFLQNVTCIPGNLCEHPQGQFGDIVSKPIKLKESDQNEGVYYFLNTPVRPLFRPGDKIALDCEKGYEYLPNDSGNEWTTEATTNDMDDIYEMYLTYDYNTELDDVATEMVCSLNGTWTVNGSIGYCKEITCDAKHLQYIANGNITNYKEVYNYHEYIELSCNEGFKPLGKVVCLAANSFESNQIRCEVITCPEPRIPIYGNIRNKQLFYTVGNVVEFICDNDYEMFGSKQWKCQDDGSWDGKCVRCVRPGDHCPAPCVPEEAIVTLFPTVVSVNSMLIFECKSGVAIAGNSTRVCLKNTLWSGEPLDCTGFSLFNANDGYRLKVALSGRIDEIQQNIKLAQPPTHSVDYDGIHGLSINVGDSDMALEGGVDVYFLVDVSKSIDENQFNATLQFIHLLYASLNVNNMRTGTSLALYFFGSKTVKIFNQHNMADEYRFKSYTDARNATENLTLESIRGKTGHGTDFNTALNEIYTDVTTKPMIESVVPAQQILILISDGKYTQSGDPIRIATELKNHRMEIYAIALNSEYSDRSGYKVMKSIASSIPGEKHIFTIGSSKEEMGKTIDMMVNAAGLEFPCGRTDNMLTEIRSFNETRYETCALRHAWPWMVQLLDKDKKHICGASLIHPRWILTAAHCLENVTQAFARFKNENSSSTDDDTKLLTKWTSHKEYNKATFEYDVALIEIDSKGLKFDSHLYAVCLWSKDRCTLTPDQYNGLFENQTYGVVTGWGVHEHGVKQAAQRLKQLQMPVWDESTCNKSLNTNKTIFHEHVMFCAGGEQNVSVSEVDTCPSLGDDSYKATVVNGTLQVDACGGDSGGPFVVVDPNNENTFIQIGIVSAGISCKKNGTYGVYTKLTQTILKWINTTCNNCL